MGAPEVTRFLTSLAVKGRVAAVTQNQALSALLFLHKDVLELDLSGGNVWRYAPIGRPTFAARAVAWRSTSATMTDGCETRVAYCPER
jgi:hypothetical protein